MPKLERQAPTQRPSRSQNVSPPSSAGIPPGPNSSGWRATIPASTIRPAPPCFTNSGAAPPHTRALPAPGAPPPEHAADPRPDVRGEERPPRVGDLADGAVRLGLPEA